MIYAVNAKPGCFTGFCQVQDPKRKFDSLNFVASHGIPGPNAVVTCIVQQYSNAGPTQYRVIEKQTALSQIPGLRYGTHALANLPRPPTWDDSPLSAAAK